MQGSSHAGGTAGRGGYIRSGMPDRGLPFQPSRDPKAAVEAQRAQDPAKPRRITSLAQMGSWWLTHTASAPAAAARATSIMASILVATARYGSPQDGRNGLIRYGQCAGRRSDPSPTPNLMPDRKTPR